MDGLTIVAMLVGIAFVYKRYCTDLYEECEVSKILKVALLVAVCTIIFLLLPSCKSVEYVQVPVVKIDSVYKDRYIYDRIVEKDSVYEKDTMYLYYDPELKMWCKTTSSYKYKETTRIDSFIKTDTIHETKIDTVTVTVYKEKKPSRYEQLKQSIGGFMIPIIVFLVCVLIGMGVRKFFK